MVPPSPSYLAEPRPSGAEPDDEVSAWAASGAMVLTGRPGQAPLGPPAGLVPKLRRIATRIDRLTARLGGHTIALDPLALLGERAAVAGLARNGTVSCGGGTRLVPGRAGWMAVNLARCDDVELVPAWLELDEQPGDPWPEVERAARSRSLAELVDRAGLLGMPVALLGSHGAAADGWGHLPASATAVSGEPVGPAALADLTVVDLSALWAGPLCASLLGRAGATVIKVESAGRPDGARSGPRPFFDLLNAGKRSVALDLSEAAGRRALEALLASADVVIEASRPRALRQMGIDSTALVRNGPRVWVSVTGYGRSPAERDRVAFGDDAAVAGGLVASDAAGPTFCADAIADPTTGLVAAAAALEALSRGGRWRIDVALAGVAASLAARTLPVDPSVVVAAPRCRPIDRAARELGADSGPVLAHLGALT